jgi:hypothetical protein
MRPLTRIPVFLCALALHGCTPSRPLEVSIEVRNAYTLAPVQGASVRGLGTTLFLPLWHKTAGLEPGASIGPPPSPPATAGTTNALGVTHLTLAGDRPNRLVIRAQGCAPIQLLVEAGTTKIYQPRGWSSGAGRPVSMPQDGPTPLEVRIRATEKKPDTMRMTPQSLLERGGD